MGKNQTLKTLSPENSLKTILNFLVEKNLRFFNPALADKNKQAFLANLQKLKMLPLGQEILKLFEKQDIDNVTSSKLEILQQTVATLENGPKNYSSTSNTSTSSTSTSTASTSSSSSSSASEVSFSGMLKQLNSPQLNNLFSQSIMESKQAETHLTSFSSLPSNSIQSIAPTLFFSRSNPTTLTSSAIMATRPAFSIQALPVSSSKSNYETEKAITGFKEIDLSKIQFSIKNQETLTLSKNLGENFKLCIKKATDIFPKASKAKVNLPDVASSLFSKNEIAESVNDVLTNTNYTSAINTHKVIETLIQEYQNGGFEQYTDKPDELFTAIIYFLLNAKNTNSEELSTLLATFDHEKPEVCSQEFQDAVISLMEFLKEDTTLCCTSFDRKKIGVELLSLLLFPNLMDQGKVNLCGVDIFLKELANKSPLRFIRLGLNLAKSGISTIPFEAKLPSEFNNKSIITAMMTSIRNTSNFTGYHPNGIFEAIRGATLPKDLYKWFSTSGFEIIEDSIKMMDENYREVPILNRTILGGIYSDGHIDLEGEAKIKYLINYVHKPHLSINCLISPAFTDFLEASNSASDIEEPDEIDMLFGNQYGHYVKVLNFSENSDTSVNIEVNTYGRIFLINNLSRESFKKHFFGAFVTEFKNPLTLSDLTQEQAIKTPGCTLL